MGGLAGHMSHPHDNLDLTFGGLRDLVRSTVSGYGISTITEKIDGYNIHILKYHNDLRFARNKKDLETGGFDLTSMNKRFSNEKIRSIYRMAYMYINDNMPWELFDDYEELGTTYNCEIVYGKTNVIPYPEELRVFVHNKWTWVDGVGFPTPFLPPYLDDWASPEVYIGHVSDFEIGARLAELETLCKGNWDMTIRSFYRKEFVEIMACEGLLPDSTNNKMLLAALFNRFFDDGPKMNLRDMRKLYDGDLDRFISNARIYVSTTKDRLDTWVLTTGTLILEAVEGTINDSKDLRPVLEVYKDLMEVGTDDIRFTRRWDATYRKVFPFEGIVVPFEGHLYKWTGPFAPINQLLGGR